MSFLYFPVGVLQYRSRSGDLNLKGASPTGRKVRPGLVRARHSSALALTSCMCAPTGRIKGELLVRNPVPSCRRSPHRLRFRPARPAGQQLQWNLRQDTAHIHNHGRARTAGHSLECCLHRSRYPARRQYMCASVRIQWQCWTNWQVYRYCAR